MSTDFDKKECQERGREPGESRSVSRREFLKIAGVAGAVLGLGGSFGGLLAACGEDETTTTTAAAVTDSTATSVTAGPDTTPWQVGALVDLTGPLATIGIDLKDGFDIEIEKLNAEGGVNGHPIEVLYEDVASDPVKCNSAAVKLATENKVPFITGPSASATNPQAMEVGEREQVPIVMFAPDDTMWHQKFWNYTYNLVVPGPGQGQAALCLAKLNNFTAMTVMSDVQPFFIGGADYMKKWGEAWGVKCDVLPDQIVPGELDMTAIATKIKSSIESNGSQAVAPFIIGSDGLNLVRALKKIGVDTRYIVNAAWGQSQLLDAAAGDLDGVQITTDIPIVCDQLPDGHPQKAFMVDMKTRFEAKFNRPFSGIAGHMYTVTQFIKQSMGEVGPDKAKIKNWLDTNVVDFWGSEGLVNYRADYHQGMDVSSYSLVEIVDNKHVLDLENLDITVHQPADLPPEAADPGHGPV